MGEIRKTVIYENDEWEVYKHFDGLWEIKPKQKLQMEDENFNIVLVPQELSSLLNILTRINLDY
ncbi:hypothetical protein [Treponema sp. R80B11-R83G3]